MISPSPLSFQGATWTQSPIEDQRVQALATKVGLSEPAARCLGLRWPQDDLVQEGHLLQPSEAHLHDPSLMLNMRSAVTRLERALSRGEKIRIITDYDVDGTTSSLILQAALKLRKPDVDLSYHIPSRFDEGYGFSVAAAERAAEEGIGLILTADIGVRDHASVQAANAAGVDVLICDHHLPAGAEVPDGATVLCPPQQGCTYPNQHLAACGVSLKLAQALLQHSHPKWPRILRSLLKLAAIGTVADMVPLSTLENRAIVSLGLAELNRGPHTPGLQCLLEVSGLNGREIRTSDLGFRIGPRINAAGRVAEANMVIELLTRRDWDSARELSQRLDGLNTQRKDIQRRLVEEALKGIQGAPAPFVLLAGPEQEGWHRGVVGIVAARIKDEVNRPTAVVSIQGDRAVGSVRSIPSVHAVRALDSASDLLVKYGGHPAAAGFTVPTEHLEALRERLCTWVSSQLPEDALVPELTYDAKVEPTHLGEGLFQELAALGPFGMGNPRPKLLIPGITPQRVMVRGANRSLLKFELPRGQGPAIEAIWWGAADHLPALKEGPVDVIAHLGVNVFRGRRTLQLEIKDARHTQGS